jgi:hypothetical protein
MVISQPSENLYIGFKKGITLGDTLMHSKWEPTWNLGWFSFLFFLNTYPTLVYKVILTLAQHSYMVWFKFIISWVDSYFSFSYFERAILIGPSPIFLKYEGCNFGKVMMMFVLKFQISSLLVRVGSSSWWKTSKISFQNIIYICRWNNDRLKIY